MPSYRFVGTFSEIWDTNFKFIRFGQSVEIPQELAEDAIAHGAALMTEDTFKTLGITQDELRRFSNPATHAKAPADFLGKRDAAWKKLHEPATPEIKAAEPVVTHTAQETK